MALLGPNGAGKTTHGRGPGGLPAVDGGHGRGSSGSTRGTDHAALVARIGVMLQKGGVYPMLGLGPGAPALRRATTTTPRTPRRCSTWSGWRGGPRTAVAAAVGRRAAAAVAGPGPGGQARGPLPRRAHRRGRPRGPHRGARHHRRPARPGHLRDPDHPRAGRGRAAGRPRGHHRPRTGPGRGIAGRPGPARADGSIRFTTDAGIDAGSLAAAVGPGPPSTRSGPAPTGSPARRCDRPRRWWPP